MNNTIRINWLDWAKCIGIYIVVVCHTPQYSTFALSFFYSFQMPLFFFLSGYLHKNTGTFIHTLKKYRTTLIIPYFLFQILFYPYWYVVQRYDGHPLSTIHAALIDPFLKCLIGIPINGVTWFLIALFIIKLYANYILPKKNSLTWSIISCIIAISARYFMYMDNDAVKISFAIDSMLLFFPFFFIGYFMNRYSVLNRISNKTKILYLLLPTAFAVSAVLMKSLYLSYGYSLLSFYLKGMSGTLFILFLCMMLKHIKLNIIYTISTGTILIFGLHWMFIGSFNFIVKQIAGIQGDIRYSTPIALLISFGIVFINYFIILLCKKHFPIILGYRK